MTIKRETDSAMKEKTNANEHKIHVYCDKIVCVNSNGILPEKCTQNGISSTSEFFHSRK